MSAPHAQTPIQVHIGETFPSRCCRCGMYTDQLIKQKQPVYVTLPAGPSAWLIVLGLLFGPLGWLMTMLVGNDDEETKTVKKHLRFRVPLCVMCQPSGGPEVVSVNPENGVVELAAHPDFVTQLKTQREMTAETTP